MNLKDVLFHLIRVERDNTRTRAVVCTKAMTALALASAEEPVSAILIGLLVLRQVINTSLTHALVPPPSGVTIPHWPFSTHTLNGCYAFPS